MATAAATSPQTNGNKNELEVSDFDMKRNLIVNYLPPTVNQDGVKELFSKIGPVSNCKLIRNYTTGQSLGYAFIEYPTEELAAEAIAKIDGMQVNEKKLKVSHARQSSPDIKQSNVYVAGLPSWVTEEKLLSLFSPFGSVLTHKVLTNADNTSRGVGFVRYGLKSEAENAINAMCGKTLADSTGPLTVKLAIPPASKQNAAMGFEPTITTHNSLTGLGAVAAGGGGGVAGRSLNTSPRYNMMTPSNQNVINLPASMMDTSNALMSGYNTPVHTPAVSVYIYGLQPTHDEVILYKLFAPFGAVINVKLIRDLTKEERPCKGYGFVNFAKYEDAHTAVVSMNNVPFEDKILQVSFKQNKVDASKIPPPPLTLSYFDK